MTTWDLLLSKSSAAAGSTAFQHLMSEGSGTCNGSRYSAQDLSAEVSNNFYAVILEESIEASISSQGVEAEVNNETIIEHTVNFEANICK